MAMSKISMLLGGAGMAISASSIIRWYFLYYDPSQAILGAGIGLLVIIIAHFHNQFRQQDKINGEHEKDMESLLALWSQKQSDLSGRKK